MLSATLLLSLSSVKSDQRVLLTLTSQDFLWGSKDRPKASFLEAENDFVRRSSGKNEDGFEGLGRGGGGGKLLDLEVEEKRDLMAAAAAAEAEEGRREEEGVLEEESRVWRRSQRQEGQKPVKCSLGWRSQLKEERGGCG